MGSTKGRRIGRTAVIVGLAFVASILTASCGLLLVPKRGHENPMDPDNPVSLVENFAAARTGDVQITLSWTMPAEKQPDKLIIVRKVGSAPTSVGDGTRHDAEDLTVTTLVDDATYGLEPGKVYWYAAWSYSAAADLATGPVYAGATTITVPPLAAFSAVATSPTSILLRWSIPTSYTSSLAGLVVRRRLAEDPSDPTDGASVGLTLENGSHLDTVSDSGVYHYGAWTRDATGLVYGEPLFDLASTTFTNLTYYPAEDGDVGSTRRFTYDTIYLYPTSWLGLMRFNFGVAGVPPFLSASLYLVRTSGWGYTIAVRQIAADWSPSTITYATAAADSFVDLSSVANMTATSVDVTEFVEAWASGAANHGLRLSATSSWGISVRASEYPAAADRPQLRVYCSEEFGW